MEARTREAHIENIADPKILAEVLKDGDATTKVYIVGGAVRDYLYHEFHGDQNVSYSPKDTDLTTNLSEEEILARLRSPLAKMYHIGVKEKQSIDTFGVVFANVSGRGPYEIAPFRKDIGSSDGRHPDRVERGTIFEDAMRRDLTINNLYYDIDQHIILDFNPQGQGINDVRYKTVRTVGNPFERFEEDKLRVLRLVRFFSRYNAGRIVQYLDEDTIDAIEKYRKLNDYRGMSPERIQMEFMLGLSQSINTASYLHNYANLDLFQAVFPDCDIHLDGIRSLSTTKNPKVVLAVLLERNQNVGSILNNLKYPNEISDAVQFLIDIKNFSPDQAVKILKSRDRRVLKKDVLSAEDKAHNQSVVKEVRQDILDFLPTVHDPERKRILMHLLNYEPFVVDGESLMLQGFQKEQIGIRQRELIQQSYTESLNVFVL